MAPRNSQPPPRPPLRPGQITDRSQLRPGMVIRRHVDALPSFPAIYEDLRVVRVLSTKVLVQGVDPESGQLQLRTPTLIALSDLGVTYGINGSGGAYWNRQVYAIVLRRA